PGARADVRLVHEKVLRRPTCTCLAQLQVEALKSMLSIAFPHPRMLGWTYVEECKGVKMIRVSLRRCVMFTLLLAMCAAGAVGPARAEAALPRTSQVAGSPVGIATL